MRGASRIVALTLLAGCASAPAAAPAPEPAPAPAPVPEPRPQGATEAASGREVIESLEFPPLEFAPPEPERFALSNGVTVFLLEDRSLPLVDVQVRFRGGSSHFPRELYGAATGLASLLRAGGTEALTPDSVDALVDYYALAVGFGGGGVTSFGSVGGLKRHLETGLELFADMIQRPRFDAGRVDVWRGQELEAVRRRSDHPGFHAAVEFNHLMYADHPIGWVMTEADLEPADLAEEKLREVHRAIYCPAHAVFGVTGDIDRAEAERLLEAAFADWTPCPGELEDPSHPDIRDEGGVFVIRRPIPQATVYMAHPGGILQADAPDYFASRIANSILGASGFTSRLVREVRSNRGLAYSAGSFWTAPREHQGVFGATTATRTESAVEAVRVILETMEGMRREPPTAEEVELAVDEIVNGFVFNFETPAQVVGRRMLYEAEGLPSDWLERYLDGVQRVTPADVHRVVREHVRPEGMTILLLGDVEGMDPPPSALGAVTEIESGAEEPE